MNIDNNVDILNKWTWWTFVGTWLTLATTRLSSLTTRRTPTKILIPQLFVNEQDENYQQRDETLQLTT